MPLPLLLLLLFLLFLTYVRVALSFVLLGFRLPDDAEATVVRAILTQPPELLLFRHYHTVQYCFYHGEPRGGRLFIVMHGRSRILPQQWSLLNAGMCRQANAPALYVAGTGDIPHTFATLVIGICAER